MTPSTSYSESRLLERKGGDGHKLSRLLIPTIVLCAAVSTIPSADSERRQPAVLQRVQEALDVRVEHPAHPSGLDRHRQRVQGIVWPALRAESIREPGNVLFVKGVEHLDDGALDQLVLQRRNAERPLPPVWLSHPRHLAGFDRRTSANF
jgi:hypothetical protein